RRKSRASSPSCAVFETSCPHPIAAHLASRGGWRPVDTSYTTFRPSGMHAARGTINWPVRNAMSTIGFHASHELYSPSQLLRYAVDAEGAEFGAGMCSDHFHPWSTAGQSGHAWSWL